MTDVEEPIINGNEEAENDEEESPSQQDDQDDENQQNVVDEAKEMVTDTDSTAFPDPAQNLDNAVKMEDSEEDELQVNSNPETQDTLDGDATMEENTIDVSEVTLVKIDPDAESMSQHEENDEDDEEQNSFELTEPILLDTTSGATITTAATSSVRNGDASSNLEDSVEEQSEQLLSGLLTTKETISTPKPPQQTQSFSVSDGNTIAKELEEQVNKLNQLLILKEKEWSAILRLKKHVEYALDQVKCTQRISLLQDEVNGPLSTTDIKACMNLIVSEKEAFNHAERQIEESIESTESENESLQSIFPFRSGNASAVATKGESFTATAALQKLCERKRKAMDDLPSGRSSRIKIVDVQSASPQIQSKVIGNGRKGAIVDVQSIIQSHRNLTGDKSVEKDKQARKTAHVTLQMTPERQFYKTLEDLIAMVEADRQLKDPPPAPAPASTPQVPHIVRSITPKPKNGKATPRPSATNSLLANPTPSSSGTLAKMLSPSTHATIGTSRGSNDVLSNSQKFATKLPTAESNLSLANLLATSKVDPKINISKLKKDRNVRDEENTRVPSQQETVPICQGCNLSRAQFVCAGCANQWYCSRECQVAAWDEHSDICSG